MKKRIHFIGAIALLTLGVLFLLDRFTILGIKITWPLLLVTIGLGLFLSNHHRIRGWLVGGIGVTLFLVKILIAISPDVASWNDLLWPIIFIIIGAMLIYRYYHPASARPR